MALDPNEKKSRLAKRGLVLLLIGLQIVTVLLILSITRYSFDKNIDEQISILLDSALDESKAQTQGFLEPSYRAVLTTKDLFNTQVIDIADNQELENYFLNKLKNNPEMNGMYFADPEGNFIFVSRDVEKELEVDDIKNDYQFMTKIIDSENSGQASFYWRNESSQLIKSIINKDDDYEARERPWYKQAVENKSLIWTEPYIFFTSNQPGITVAAPVYKENNQLVGVVGIDVSLTMLSDFFRDLKVYGSVSAFMMSSVGNFVAAPSIGSGAFELETLKADSGDETRLALEKKAVSNFLSTRIKTGESAFSGRFEQDGTEYFARYEPLKLQDGAEWIMTAYVSEQELLSKMRSGENKNELIALFILAVSLVIGWALLRRVWLPFERLFHDVITDQLTGLFNRRFLENIGSRMYIRLLRNQHEFISIAVIDIDYFKKINIEYGNAVGDRILISFAEFLKNTLRSEDIITRYGGDTFAVIMPGLNHNDALNVINNMQQQLDAWPLPVDDLLIKLSFSAGVETIDETSGLSDTAFTDFIQIAKRAMKNAKATGRDRVESANAETVS